MISGIVVLSQLFLSTRLSVIKKTSIVIMLLVGLYMINIAANNLGYDIKDVVENRILEKGNDMGSAKARIRSYEVFLKVFPENPWFGVGPETKKNVIDMLEGVAPLIHVGYLSYLYYYGIVGCLLLFLAIFFLLKYAWEIGKKHNFWGTFYGLISFCLANLTFVYFNLSELGIVISLVYLRYFKYKSSVELFERLLKMRAILPKEAQLIATK
jgi:O-antigen ligase